MIKIPLATNCNKLIYSKMLSSRIVMVNKNSHPHVGTLTVSDEVRDFINLLGEKVLSQDEIPSMDTGHALSHRGVGGLMEILGRCFKGDLEWPEIVLVLNNRDIVFKLPQEDGVQLTVPTNGYLCFSPDGFDHIRRFSHGVNRTNDFGHEISLFTKMTASSSRTMYFVLTQRRNVYSVIFDPAYVSPTSVPFYTAITRCLQLEGVMPSLPLVKRNPELSDKDFIDRVKGNTEKAASAWGKEMKKDFKIFVRYMPTEADRKTEISDDLLKSLYEKSLEKATLVTSPK